MTDVFEAPERFSGWAILVGSSLSVFAMARHPSTDASGTAERLAEMAGEAELSALVHGSLIALMLLVLVGLLGLAAVLGWRLGRVRLGVTAYSVGVLCMVGAALVSGFIVPGLASSYADGSPAELEAVVPVFSFCFRANQALAKIGVVAMSTGIFCWSLVLLERRSWARGIGILGLVVGTLPVVGLLSGRLALHVHGMLAVVAAQAVWSVCVGMWLIQLSRR